MSGQKSVVTGVAGRYATALFELAREQNVLDQVAADLDAIQAMLDKSEDLRRLVRSPVFDREDQARAMAAVLERAGLSQLIRNFVGVVARHRRLFVLDDMITAFRRLLAAHRGEVTAEVTAARPLVESQVGRLRAVIEQAVGQDVQINITVDKSLLGGVVVRLGSRMIDTSIATQLTNIQRAMREA